MLSGVTFVYNQIFILSRDRIHVKDDSECPDYLYLQERSFFCSGNSVALNAYLKNQIALTAQRNGSKANPAKKNQPND